MTLLPTPGLPGSGGEETEKNPNGNVRSREGALFFLPRTSFFGAFFVNFLLTFSVRFPAILRRQLWQFPKLSVAFFSVFSRSFPKLFANILPSFFAPVV